VGRTRRPAHRGRFLRTQRRLKANRPSTVLLYLLSHTTATVSVKSSLSQHRRTVNCSKWRTRATASSKSEFDRRRAAYHFQIVRLWPESVLQYSSAAITDSSMLAPASVAIVACEQSNALGHDDFPTLSIPLLCCAFVVSRSLVVPSHTPLCSANMSRMSDLLNLRLTLPATLAQIIILGNLSRL
jgi:hypothetical protein